MPSVSDDFSNNRDRGQDVGTWDRLSRSLPYLGLFYTAYVVLGGFSEKLALIPGVAIRFWPPAGVFVAALLLTPRSWRPWLVLTGGLAELTCNGFWFGNRISFALIYYAANALEALTAAWLIDRFAPKPFRMETLEEVAAFVALGAGVAPMTGATVIAVTDALLGKHSFFTAWPLVWLGDGTGLLVSMPLTFMAAQVWRERARISVARVVEAASLGLIMLAVIMLTFQGRLPTAYMTMPPLLWTAARFQLRGAAVSLAFITLMTALFTAIGEGEFAGRPEPRRQQIVMLQAFLGVCAVSAMIVAAISQQHRNALLKLRAVNAQLEERVAERTASLRESEERLRLAAEATGFGVYEWDPGVGKASWTKEFRRIFGFSEDAGEDPDAMLACLHPDDRSRFLAQTGGLEGLGQSAEPETEFRIVFEDGQTRWIQNKARWFRAVNSSSNSSPSEGAQAPSGRIIGTVLDVTERVKAEEALRESEARFRSVFEHAGTGIAITSANGSFHRCNPAYSAIVGYTEDELREMHFADLIHPDDREENVALGRRLLASDFSSFQIENRYVRKDGKPVWVHKFVSMFRDDAGEPVRHIVLVTDVTARRAAEQVLRDSDRKKDEFLATLAHELRNPLAPVRNAVQLLHMQGPATPELERARDIIDRQVRAMSRLIDELMDISRINLGKVELKRERVELAQVAQSAVETSRPLIDELGHELTVALPSSRVILDADPTRLAQVLQNLLNNAAKYMERGGRIWLTIETREGVMSATVKDMGIGIPADKLPTIFEMFSQVEGALTRSRGGLGIGLYLVKQLVEMHGGQVAARSEGPARGSEFTVRLPIVAEESRADDSEGPKESLTTSDLRILVVDDNFDAAESLAMLLTIMGNQVRAVHDGESAVIAAAEFRPHVTLCDIGLPKLNGYEVCKRIRQEPWGRSMTLVAVTGWGQDGDKRNAQDAGFDRHMVKPVDPQALMELLAAMR